LNPLRIITDYYAGRLGFNFYFRPTHHTQWNKCSPQLVPTSRDGITAMNSNHHYQ